MLSCQSDSFRLDPGVHYLNCAFMSPLPIRVEEAGMEAIRTKRNPSRISADDFYTTSDLVREEFAALIGAKAPNRVSIGPSVSYATSSAAHNLKPGPGQSIVTLAEQFPSNVYTWRRLAARNGAEIRTIAPPEGENREVDWNLRVLDAIDSRTAVVALPVVHWADGSRFDLVTIGQRARDVGAAFIVDGTQSIGAMPFDVGHVQPDMVVAAGYKWLMGPYSTALAWWGERFLDGAPIEDNWITHRDSRNFAGLVEYQDDYEDGAIRFDVGERSNFFLLPMLLEALKMIREWGPDSIQKYVHQLVSPRLEQIRSLGFRIAPEETRGSHLFGIRMPGHIQVQTVREALDNAHVSVSVRGSAIRVAPNVYNDEQDMAALVDALRRAAT